MKFTGVVLVAVCISVALAEPLQKTLYKDVEEPASKIVGGQPANRYEFPYQISLQFNGQHVCGGSILTQKWVITAGHCIVGSVYQMKVYAGMLEQGESHPDVQVSGVAKQITHAQYPGGVAKYDIALLELVSPLTFTAAVQPIALPRSGEEFTGVGLASGWGYLTSSFPITPKRLQKVNLQIWSQLQCAANLIGAIGSSQPLDESMICFGAIYANEAVCQGDSGGPVVQNGKLLGVASWTLTPCGGRTNPSVYTKVSHYIDWIKLYVPGI